MLDKSRKLEISEDEFALIEDALQTQSQILNVQANAGGAMARRRLNVVKRMLARMAHERPQAETTGQKPCKASSFWSWLGARAV